MRSSRTVWVWTALALAAAGCSVDGEGRLRGDAGKRDSSTAADDAGPVTMEDTGTAVDGGPTDVDAGPPTGLDGGPPPSCERGTSRCSTDGTEQLDCVDGFSIDSTHCSRGCDSRTAECRPATECRFDPDLVPVPGDHAESTCGHGDMHRFDPAPSDDTCTSGYPADGEDVVVRFELDRPTRLRLQLRDYDTSNDLDAMLYIFQGGCETGDTMIACDDDSGDWMGNRAAEIERDFDAGEYFVVMDIFDASAGWEGCGTLRLEIEVR